MRDERDQPHNDEPVRTLDFCNGCINRVRYDAMMCWVVFCEVGRDFKTCEDYTRRRG